VSKSELVKVGVSSARAEGVRFARDVRAMLEQHEAHVARLDAALRERIRQRATAEVEGGDERRARISEVDLGAEPDATATA